MEKFAIYTDGACDNYVEPHYGGWAYVILEDGEIIEENSGYETDTTNNKMELAAINASISELPYGSSVTIYTDSQYCIGVLSKHWKARENKEFIEEFFNVVNDNALDVSFEWVKGHSGDKWNEYVNDKAYAEFSKLKEGVCTIPRKYDYKKILERLVEAIDLYSTIKRANLPESELKKARIDYANAFKSAKDSIWNK